MACCSSSSFGVERVQVEPAVQYVDHNILQLDFKNPDDHRFLQAFARATALYFSRPGNGICHYVHFERFADAGPDARSARTATRRTSGSLRR